MGKLTKSIEIEASPEEVFAFFIDQKKMNEATKGFAEVEYTSKGPVGVGTTAHHIGKVGSQQGEWDMEVTEFVKNKKMSDRTLGASKVKITDSWTFEPTAKGTKVSYTMEYKAGKLLDALVVKRMVEKEDTKMLENMKKALEA